MLSEMKKKMDVLMSKPPSTWTEEDKKLVNMLKGLK